MKDYTCKDAKGCGGYEANVCENCGVANPQVVGKKHVSTHDYVMALAMNHDPATVIVGDTKIPVLITDVDSRHMANCAPETTFTCQIVNLPEEPRTPGFDKLVKAAVMVHQVGLRSGKSYLQKETILAATFAIDRVYFNDPVTVVLWKDGTKTIVRCQEGDTYSAETGLALCFAKKALGNKGNFNDVFKKYVPEEKVEKTPVEEPAAETEEGAEE